jgi:hypothetical protein
MKRILQLGMLLALVGGMPLAAQESRPGLAVAEEPAMRKGFYLQFGMGGGEERLDLDNDFLGYSDPIWALTLNLRGGFALNPHMRLGIDFNSWIRPEGEFTESASSVGPNLQLYPARNLGLHIRGGGGYAWSSFYDNNYCCSSITYGGVGTNLGVGWDIPVSRKVAITPTFDWYQYWIDNNQIGGYTERILSFGLAVSFQTH